MMKLDLPEDIYFQYDYSNLYTIDVNNELFEYTYRENDKYVLFRSIKRPITQVAGVLVEEELYDLETHYGYGGPLTNNNDVCFLSRAFLCYKEYCRNKKIVSEFIRFHPFNSMSTVSNLFDFVEHERDVVIVDLECSSDERRQRYSKTTRNIVKKAQKTLTVSSSNECTDSFITLYYETMKHNKANDFFYFDDKYFNALSKIEGVTLVSIENEQALVSSGFFMCGHDLAHYHLSANNRDFFKDNGNYLLLDAAFELAKLRGCKRMMLGGGRTSSPEDSLFKFKKKFSPEVMPFYIAGLDFWPSKRKELNKVWCDQRSTQTPPKLFQLYRS